MIDVVMEVEIVVKVGGREKIVIQDIFEGRDHLLTTDLKRELMDFEHKRSAMMLEKLGEKARSVVERSVLFSSPLRFLFFWIFFS